LAEQYIFEGVIWNSSSFKGSIKLQKPKYGLWVIALLDKVANKRQLGDKEVQIAKLTLNP